LTKVAINEVREGCLPGFWAFKLENQHQKLDAFALACHSFRSQHVEQEAYNNEHTIFLESKSCRVLRFWNNAVLNNLGGVLRTILEALEMK
jgi:hypothetical protein